MVIDVMDVYLVEFWVMLYFGFVNLKGRNCYDLCSTLLVISLLISCIFISCYLPLFLVFRVHPAPAGPIVLSAQRNRSLLYIIYTYICIVLFCVCSLTVQCVHAYRMPLSLNKKFCCVTSTDSRLAYRPVTLIVLNN